jgi:hypothetical protein
MGFLWRLPKHVFLYSFTVRSKDYQPCQNHFCIQPLSLVRQSRRTSLWMLYNHSTCIFLEREIALNVFLFEVLYYKSRIWIYCVILHLFIYNQSYCHICILTDRLGYEKNAGRSNKILYLHFYISLDRP